MFTMSHLTRSTLPVLLLTSLASSLLVSASPYKDTEEGAKARELVTKLLSQVDTKQEAEGQIPLKFGAEVKKQDLEIQETQETDNREISDQNPIWDKMGYEEKGKGLDDAQNQEERISDQSSLWDVMGYMDRAKRPKNNLKRVNLQATVQQDDKSNISDQSPLWDIMGYLDKARHPTSGGMEPDQETHKENDESNISDQSPLWDIMGYIDKALREHGGILKIHDIEESLYRRLQEILRKRENRVQASIQSRDFKREALNVDKEMNLDRINDNRFNLETALVQRRFAQHIMHIWHLMKQTLATKQGSSTQEQELQEKDINRLRAKIIELLAEIEKKDVKASSLPKFTDPGFFMPWERE